MRFDSTTVYQLSLRTFTPEGTIASATKLLPFLAGLGLDFILLCPLTVADDDGDRTGWSDRQLASGTGNPKNTYRTKDYFAVDPEYGDERDLLEFCQLAHRLGLRVMFDLVYLHCGPNAVFLAEHPDYVVRKPDGGIDCGEWHFPLLNFQSDGLCEYLYRNMIHYIERYGADGFRCDVGDMVPLDFWAEGIRRVRAIKPDVYMVNEGRNPEYLTVFDANYFYDGCFDAVKVAKGELPASDFVEKWTACNKQLPPGGRMLRFIDNHDVASDSLDERHEKTIGTEGVAALLVLDFTLDGVPFVFNGYEVGDALKHSMFANRFYGRDATVNWANALCESGQRRMELFRTLHALRKEHTALQGEALTWLPHDAPESVLAFARPDPHGDVVAIINTQNRPVSVHVEREEHHPALLVDLLEKGTSHRMEGDRLSLDMLPYGYWVYKSPGEAGP